MFPMKRHAASAAAHSAFSAFPAFHFLPSRSVCAACIACALLCAAASAQAAVPATPAAPGTPGATATAPASAPLSATAQPVQPDYNPIYEKNIFDPERKPWSEKPVVNIPAAPPITSSDVQLYGVIMVGNVKKALVKLEGRLKSSIPSTRPFVALNEGQRVGEYTLAEIHPKELVFSAGDGRYRIAFNKKTDRPAPLPAPPVIQGPSIATTEAPTIVPGLTPPPPPQTPTPMAPQQSAMPMPMPPPMPGAMQPGNPNTQTASNSPSGMTGNNAASSNTANTASANTAGRGMSLLEAIEQAKRSGTQSPPNPFIPR